LSVINIYKGDEMMNNLTLINKDGVFYVDSREVAEMTGKEHKNLIRDIENYEKTLSSSNELKFEPVNFFVKNTYQDVKGQARPCYLLTRRGCDMVANKMTGEKGVLFTAAYVTKFEEMEHQLQQPQVLTTNPYILALIDIDQKQAALKTSLDAVEASQKTLETKVKDLENTIVLGKAFFGPPPVPVAAPTQEPLPLPLLAIAEHPSKQSKPRQRKPKMSKLRKLRVEKGLSSSDVAKIVGISPSHLNHIETGGAVPSYKTLQGIAKALGVTTARVAGYLS
jgi:Rha family phage regulatory protein